MKHGRSKITLECGQCMTVACFGDALRWSKMKLSRDTLMACKSISRCEMEKFICPLLLHVAYGVLRELAREAVSRKCNPLALAALIKGC